MTAIKGKPHGQDLGQLTMDHWGWNLCGGDGDGGDTFAFFNPECAGQEDVPDGFQFLAGIAGLGGNRVCTLPKNKFIFLPVINSICWEGDGDCEGMNTEDTIDCLLDFCKEWVDGVNEGTLEAALDGKDLEIRRLVGQTESFDYCPTDVGTIAPTLIGVPSTTDGYWVLIPPLSVGEHELTYFGEVAGVFQTGGTFTITVDAN